MWADGKTCFKWILRLQWKEGYEFSGCSVLSFSQIPPPKWGLQLSLTTGKNRRGGWCGQALYFAFSWTQAWALPIEMQNPRGCAGCGSVWRENLPLKNIFLVFLHIKQMRCRRKEWLYDDINNSLLCYSPDYSPLTWCNLYQMCFPTNWELLCLCTILFHAPVLHTVQVYWNSFFFPMCSEILLKDWTGGDWTALDKHFVFSLVISC